MSDDNIYNTSPTQRDDLKHVDTVASGDTPLPGIGGGGDAGPISTRVGRDPSNLGDEIPVAGDITVPSAEDEVPMGADLTHPSPINEPLGKAPGM
jgi:hypothetical protein